MNKIKGKIYNENYVDIDTNQKHNLIIYDYSINDKTDKLFVGEIIDNNIDIQELIDCLNKIADYNVNRKIPMFAGDLIRFGKNKKLFEKVNFSKQGYNFIFNKDLSVLNCDPKTDPYEGDFLEKLKEIVIIDYIARRFSSIGDNNLGVHPLDYYENDAGYPEIGVQKCLKYPNAVKS